MSSRFSTSIFFTRGRFAPNPLSHMNIYFRIIDSRSHATNCARVPPCRSPTSLIGCEIILKNSTGPGETGWSPTYYVLLRYRWMMYRFLERSVKFFYICETWNISVRSRTDDLRYNLLSRIYIWLGLNECHMCKRYLTYNKSLLSIIIENILNKKWQYPIKGCTSVFICVKLKE